METSDDSRIFYGGGSTHFELQKGSATIFALSFDENIEFIQERIIDIPDVPGPSTKGISCMRRIPETEVLILGVNTAVIIVEWTGEHFELLGCVPEIHTCKKGH